MKQLVLCVFSMHALCSQIFEHLSLLIEMFYPIPKLVVPLYCKDQHLGYINNFTESPLWHVSFKRRYFGLIVSLKSLKGKDAICLNECVLCLFSPQKDLLAHFTWTCRRQREFLY